MILQNHKNVENIKFMNFLFTRKTNKNLDLTYDFTINQFQLDIINK